MQFYKIKSYAKINLSLGVLGKLKSNLHKIESLISFINLHDQILIKKINDTKHIIKFTGKFSKNISKNNTIVNLLKILDNNKKLQNKKYLIKVNKNIPQKSGMGGGSVNAASVLKYLLNKEKLKLSSKEILQITSKIGSDVIIGMKKKLLIFYGDGELKIVNNKINFFTVLLKPNFGCSTKSIYKSVRYFSKPFFKKNKISNLNKKILINLKNDLETSAFKRYSKLQKLKIFMEKLDNILFARMTGSGSTMVGYFTSKKSALNALKILKKKYKNCWCILSKTI